MPKDMAQDPAFGARAARALLATPPPPSPPVFAQLATRWDGGATGQLQWQLARMGKRFRGCHAKRFYIYV